ncbi:putative bifunctional diguanylate cyclase/phosphodiesterase [Aliamphritea hakodatensis]|uniref:putative bifunctional diguanylate cyclase/phosphodiesterase n=1 Tax=Aliamphritea hakodatensis TaxID=2895352 RepID=UPI0022FD8B08|nr:bifunctional diguanylate cyclase/phosphodiesterase [Aliamphritea hakodatensis]
MSFITEINKVYDDKQIEKSLRKRIFFGFLIVTSIISLLFIVEGYDSAVDFGKQAEGFQLHENAIHVVETLEFLDANSDENIEEYMNISDHLHTRNEAAVIYMLNGREVVSSSDLSTEHLNKLIPLIRTIDKESNYDRHYYHSKMCDDEYCIVECDGYEYNWMIYHSDMYGDVLVIQKYNLKELARDYVIPRMLTSAFVVIWLGIWSSFGIALVLSKLISKYQKSLQFHVFHDRVTKLPNEKYLIDKLYHINDIDDSIEIYGLVMISVDNIDSIQSLHGLEVRELLMSKVAKTINDNIDGCVVGNYSRDVFYVLFSYDEHKLKTIKNLFTNFPCKEFNVSRVIFNPVFSLGVNSFSDDFYSPNEVISGACSALKKAKDYRSGCVVFTDADGKRINTNNLLNQDLDNAIKNQEFVLHYQPKISLIYNEIVGVEALIRWNHPKRGIIYPDQFIHLIENSSIAKKFTANVADMAIHQINEWASKGLDIKVAINVSPYDLADEEFSNYLLSLFASGTLKRHQIEIELTEVEHTVDIKHLSKVLYQLRDIGVDCSIDDFGTGMGSLTYLKDIPVHAVKIDKSFVMDMDVNPASEAITESTIKLANKLGCKVIAEGIENACIERMLFERKCDVAQGYHYSKPLSADELADYIFDYNQQQEEKIKLFIID